MKLQDELWDVIVVGGGASGMMAAGVAAEQGKKVLVLEKGEALGKKLKITGGGRCNITNAEYDVRKLLSHYGKAADFLYSPFAQFGVKDTFSFFESRGLPLVVQARQRAFPHTEKASDVFKVLEKYMREGKVAVALGQAVTKIRTVKKDGGTEIECVDTKQGRYSAKSYVLATGGMSHPETGSTGDGFGWLRDLGHTVKTPTPTIVPIKVEDRWSKILAGVSLSFMKIAFFLDGKRSFSKTGKVLFTHFGLSGPLILNSASQVADLLNDGTVTATIDMYPDTDLGAFEKKVIAAFDANKNKSLKNMIKEIVPVGTAPGVLMLIGEMAETGHIGLTGETKVHSVSKEDRKKLVHLIKAMPLTISGLMGYDRAVVADGGVALDEIDMRTMRSNKISNMFVTGDLLDITRPSGGYSLQLCWTTGYIAGMNA